jgi:hypothetical protein
VVMKLFAKSLLAYVVFALPLLTVLSAPVPKGAERPKPDPIQPGYSWRFSGYVLMVVEVEGERVRYKCLNRPRQTWGGCDGYAGPNEQSKSRVREEEKTYRFHDSFPWEPEF